MFQAAVFALLAAMVLVWFRSVSKLCAQLRERHTEKFDEMGLERMWPKDLGGWIAGYNNAGPVAALLRFLWRREDAELNDAEVSSLASSMRWFLAAYLVLFLALACSILFDAAPSQPRPAAVDAYRTERWRERVFVPYREKRFADAVAAYDAMQPDSGKDALLTYWRGMSNWQLGQMELALQDFRRTIDMDPANFDAHRNADRILSQQKRWDEILALWNRYIESAPANAEAYFERGGTNFHKGDLAAAQADAAKACELGKQEACAWAEKLKPRL